MPDTLPQPADSPATGTRIDVHCLDLDAAIDFYTGAPGFRLDMIMPADAPRVAELSGHGITLHLERFDQCRPCPGSTDAEAADAGSIAQTAVFAINRAGTKDAWADGRAGMQYRDLIPGRLGGRVIASHIRIRDGGLVPDYVHYHQVGFQMIFCRRGWVRVVYEDQGPAFVMHAGDCVLQPPTIRHRVLEASPGLEVIEVGCPAEHPTFRDHDLQLPTKQLCPERDFGGQRFVRHVAADSVWQRMADGCFDRCDTGIGMATNGLADVRIVRTASSDVVAATACVADSRVGNNDFRIVSVLEGRLQLNGKTGGPHVLEPDDACLVAADGDWILQPLGPAQWLEITVSSHANTSCA